MPERKAEADCPGTQCAGGHNSETSKSEKCRERAYFTGGSKVSSFPPTLMADELHGTSQLMLKHAKNRAGENSSTFSPDGVLQTPVPEEKFHIRTMKRRMQNHKMQRESQRRSMSEAPLFLSQKMPCRQTLIQHAQ